jgi:hypothetical protein
MVRCLGWIVREGPLVRQSLPETTPEDGQQKQASTAARNQRHVGTCYSRSRSTACASRRGEVGRQGQRLAERDLYSDPQPTK